MKYFIYITLILLVASCDKKPASNSSQSEEVMTDSLIMDSVLTFPFETNFSDPNISNKSDKQIDLLFNSVEKYFGGRRNSAVNFRSECLSCEPIQEYMGGLLFAKRLLITKNQIEFHKTDFKISDSTKRIKVNTNEGERTNPSFHFTDGTGSIKYFGVSCDDADFNKVNLSYPSGEIAIDSLINASFFEYDLNMDGEAEQYLLGSRSCSQELVLLRIRRQNHAK